MRILWVSHSSDVGGAELSMAESVRALSARGHSVHVVLPASGPLSNQLTSAASVRFCWHNRWVSRPGMPLRDRLRWSAYNVSVASREIARLAETVGAQIVVSNTVVVVVGALAALRLRKPHAWFLHEYGLEDHGLVFHFGRRPSLAFMHHTTDLVLVNSLALRAHFTRWLPARQVQRVHYAINVPPVPIATRASRRDLCRLVLVGRRVPSKGPQDAIEAVGILAGAGRPVCLELLGSGDQAFERELRSLAAAARVEDLVKFVDPQDEHFARVANADIGLMCSRSEAFGRVTIEAMKLGKPVVGASAGATPELIRHGWNGLLYESGDVAGLARCIDYLATEQAVAHEMGERGRSWALATFNDATHATELEEAFDPLVVGTVDRRSDSAVRLEK